MNIRYFVFSLFAVAALSISPFALAADPAPSKPKTTPMDTKPSTPMLKEPLKNPTLPSPIPKTGVLPRAGCPDLAVQLFMAIGNPARNPDGTYNFGLAATVQNVGGAPYRTKPNQQSLAISEGPRVLVSERVSGNLAPGDGRTYATYNVIRWNPSSEFLVDFVAQLNFDPDIRMDGNPENDDCNASNNTARLTVGEIRRRLESLPR